MVVFTALVGFVTASAASPWSGLLIGRARRDGPRGRRRERPQHGDGARHRRAHAPNALAADPGRTHPARRGPLVRRAADAQRARAAREPVRRARGARGLLDLGQLPLPLHAAQAADAPLDARRRRAGRAAAGDRLGRRQRPPRARRLHPVRDRVPVADPPLPRDRLALPRRLRARRLPDAAGDRPRGPAHGAPGGAPQRRAARGEPRAGRRRARRHRLPGGGAGARAWRSRSPRCGSRARGTSWPRARCSWPRCCTFPR